MLVINVSTACGTWMFLFQCHMTPFPFVRYFGIRRGHQIRSYKICRSIRSPRHFTHGILYSFQAVYFRLRSIRCRWLSPIWYRSTYHWWLRRVSSFGSSKWLKRKQLNFQWKLIPQKLPSYRCSSIPVYLAWLKYLSWMMYANEAMTIVQWEGVENISTASMCWAGAKMIFEMFVLSLFSLHWNGSAIAVSSWCDRYLWPVQFPARPFPLRFVGNDLPIRWFQYSGIYHFVVPNKTILLISL